MKRKSEPLETTRPYATFASHIHCPYCFYTIVWYKESQHTYSKDGKALEKCIKCKKLFVVLEE